ncbi:MAG: hypothetical protein AAGB12_12870 [Pseudomonadota bacterium]
MNSRDEEDPESVILDLEYEVEKFKSVVDLHEKTCKDNGYDLPYVKPQK